MTVDIESIARIQRCDVASLRVAYPLLQQGYSPPYLARYRNDELGGLGEGPLWALLHAVRSSEQLEQRRAELAQRWEGSVVQDPACLRVLKESRTQRGLDRVSRRLRSEPTDPAHRLAARFLSPQRDDPTDPTELARLVIEAEQIDSAVSGLDRAISARLAGDLRLVQVAIRWLAKNAKIKVVEIADPHVEEKSQPQPTAVSSKNSESQPKRSKSDTSDANTTQAESENTENLSSEALSSKETTPSGGLEGIKNESPSQPDASKLTDDNAPAEASAESTSPVVSDQNNIEPKEDSVPVDSESVGSNPSQAKPSPKSKKKISPRQRRRRWLVGVLQPLKGKTLIPNKMTSFQRVMLGRAMRSDVAQCAFQYDAAQLIEHLVKTASTFNKAAADLLGELVGQHEAKIREAAELAWWDELVDNAATRLVSVAAQHLRRQMLREPIDARIVLSIDAIGPQTAAIAVVTADGHLIHTEDIPYHLSSHLRHQTVTRLGELVHQFQIDLIVVSNGPARRASLVVLSELLDQSQSGSLKWTLVERSGADLYANGPVGNAEFRSTPRRFRAATWLAFQALAPTQAHIKVDPSKLRLGSFQRELVDQTLEKALADIIVSGVCNDGVDINRVDPTCLARLPGLTPKLADDIHKARQEQPFSSREDLEKRIDWPDDTTRNQALGFLRVFGSEQTFDGTLIHPKDYGLASKLTDTLTIPKPPDSPPGYVPLTKSISEPEETGSQQVDGEAESTALPSVPDEAEPNSDSSQSPLPTSEVESGTGDEEPDVASSPETQATAEPIESEIPEGPQDTDKAEPAKEDALVSSVDKESVNQQDVSEIATFRTPEPTASKEAVPAPPTIPEPYRVPPPDEDKVVRCIKEWQVGPRCTRQIIRWLCDPFTSGVSSTTSASAAVMYSVPKLGELKPGDQVAGVVVGIASFGVFVELGPDCSGLIHVSRLSDSYVEDLHEAVQVGDVVVGWVTGVDAKRRRVALSALSPSQETKLAEQRRERRDKTSQRGHGRGKSGSSKPASRGRASAGGRAGASSGSRDSRSGGGRQRGGNRGHRSHGGKQEPRVYTKTSSSKAPPPPITEAMEKGDEPLRTFGDLMQFFQKDKDQQTDSAGASSSPQPSTPAASEPSLETESESKPSVDPKPETVQVAEGVKSSGVEEAAQQTPGGDDAAQ